MIVVAYDSGPALLPCVASIWADEPDWEVVVVDNGGGGEELDAVAAAGRVTIVRPTQNLGFAGGCNLGAKVASADTLVFLNPDTVIAPGSLRRLVEPLADPEIGIVTGRLRLLDQPELLHAAGTVIHVSGLGWSHGYGTSSDVPVMHADAPATLTDVTAPCGAAMALRTEVFRELGGFHDEFFLYQEDVQLGWRAQMSGRRVVYAPAADVYHDYDFERHGKKRYFMERNRIAFLGTCFSARTLVLLAPVLLVTELMMLLLAARQGWLRDKLAGWAWLFKNGRRLLSRRRETQRARTVRDRDLAWLLTAVVNPGNLKVPVLVRALNPLLVGYWVLVRRAL
ncbi:MAG TPA: glycosyltransferase family 2 protein [Gaiellaceae bacterium]|nr:glycosyltransferase family 2 protein [Gaiellaceae bacterium]